MGILDKLFSKNLEITAPLKTPQTNIDPNTGVIHENIRYNPYTGVVYEDSADNQDYSQVEKPQITIPDIYENKQRAYFYDDVQLINTTSVPLEYIELSERLSLVDVETDIEVYQGKMLIGYMPRNRLSGMVRDWNTNDDPYLAYISNYSNDGKDIQIALAFYIDKIARFLSKNKDAKLIKLSGRPEEDAFPVIGSECGIDYDYEKDKYFVYLDGFIIGILPSSAVKYATDHEIEPDELEVIIESVEYDINRDRDVISVYISD